MPVCGDYMVFQSRDEQDTGLEEFRCKARQKWKLLAGFIQSVQHSEVEKLRQVHSKKEAEIVHEHRHTRRWFRRTGGSQENGIGMRSSQRKNSDTRVSGYTKVKLRPKSGVLSKTNVIASENKTSKFKTHKRYMGWKSNDESENKMCYSGI
mmetsp:Transcript_41293/g.47600  ORF Transcript_41293/g.47600 Transcript_41293/m.47600 type:complete len:151 (+) Transcript_41293:257-709(+)|eukprot:CAMPEP_0168321824 /NCGR_PEP_ID=MMETSP0213-20121227/2515_1 /TAXON_ID=151035 /ORGANISM="Euplotes harpa, Strain FSP1.4" /LENGTH=150 /DNA_ID=CAMNT_0008323577 /DNA_START=245 /DNA_END=697 /DNA_ORIENTATION=+